jgi:hypothetical protein
MPLDAPPCAAHDGFIMNANSDKDYIDTKASDVRTAVDDLRVTMSERFAAVHSRFDAVDVRIDSAVAKGVSEMIKWVVGLFVTTIALNVALASVVLHVALREPSPAPVVTTPAVIIQLTPQGATVVPAAPAVGKP